MSPFEPTISVVMKKTRSKSNSGRSSTALNVFAGFTAGVAFMTVVYTLYTAHFVPMLRNRGNLRYFDPMDPQGVTLTGAAPREAVAVAPGVSSSTAEILEESAFCPYDEHLRTVPFELSLFEYSPENDAKYPCHWATVTQQDVPRSFEACTADPTVDAVSADLHNFGRWMQDLEFGILVGTGMCSEERPWMIDVGSHYGSVSGFAAMKGCNVLAMDPVPETMHRFYKTISKLQPEEAKRVVMLQNAAYGTSTLVHVLYETRNVGGARVTPVYTGEDIEIDFRVAAAAIDDLNVVSTPIVDQYGKQIHTSRVHLIKISAEIANIDVLYGARRAMVEDKVPFIMTTLHSGAGCNLWEAFQFAYANGYVAFDYATGMKLDEWQERISSDSFVSTFVTFVHDTAYDFGMLPKRLEPSALHAFGRLPDVNGLIRRARR